MICMLFANRHRLAAAIVTFLVIDIVVASILVSIDPDEDKLPSGNGIGFGFYKKTTDVRG